MRAAGIKVALSGVGGNEMFAGYSSFREIPGTVALSDSVFSIPRDRCGIVSVPTDCSHSKMPYARRESWRSSFDEGAEKSNTPI